MRFRFISAALLSLLGLIVIGGCSSDNSKAGVRIQEGDYAHAPGGGGGAPKHGGGAAAQAPTG
jgi:hypothetical protein